MKIIFTVVALLNSAAWAASNEVGLWCTGSGHEIVIPSANIPNGEAFLYEVHEGRQYSLAHFRVAPDALGRKFTGEGFSMELAQDSSVVSGWTGTYEAVVRQGTRSGQMMCDWIEGTIRPPKACTWPRPSCSGMRYAACANGVWKCIGGGH